MTDPLARLELESNDGALTARISGEIDVSNAAHLAQEIRKASPRAESLQLDLTDVTFIDSAGLRMLQQLARLGDAGVPLTVTVQPDSNVLQLLQITALDRVISVDAQPAE